MGYVTQYNLGKTVINECNIMVESKATSKNFKL